MAYDAADREMQTKGEGCLFYWSQELDESQEWDNSRFSYEIPIFVTGSFHGAEGRTSGGPVQRGSWSSPICRTEYILHEMLVGMCI